MNNEPKIKAGSQELAEDPAEEMSVPAEIAKRAIKSAQENTTELPESYFDGMPYPD